MVSAPIGVETARRITQHRETLARDDKHLAEGRESERKREQAG